MIVVVLIYEKLGTALDLEPTSTVEIWRALSINQRVDCGAVATATILALLYRRCMHSPLLGLCAMPVVIAL